MRYTCSSAMNVVSFVDARRIVERQAALLKPLGFETVSLLEARTRILAERMVADRDFPPFPRAIRDGYAVRSADLASLPMRLAVVGEIKAGASPQMIGRGIHPGEAAEIMTGAPVPAGADAVVMVEYTSRTEGTANIARAVCPGENIVPQGAEAKAGDVLLDAGTRLEQAAVAVAASVGRAQVQVYTKPRVAILATGDELVEITAQPGPNQIRNSNSYSLAVQVAAAGARAVVLPVARDDLDDLRRLIVLGLREDLLLLSGGVSMGKYDLVERVLAGLNAEFFFTGVLIQPGRPLVFGRCGALLSENHHREQVDAAATGQQLTPRASRLFFGLPGNPVSTMVTFALFVRPVIDALAGAHARPLVFSWAKLKSELRTRTGLTRFLPAVLGGEFDHAEVEPVPWQGSGDIAAAARANCYLVVPPDRERLEAGEMVNVLIRETG
jgi:molybdopterin molybdotransferase